MGALSGATWQVLSLPRMDQQARWLSLLERLMNVQLDEPYLYLEGGDGSTRLVRAADS
jgi:hypothetical protein